MRLCCPAKINLHLRVGRRRSDGFHPLLTWMTTVGLFDSLTLHLAQISPAGASRAEGSVMRLRSTDPSLPCDASNLVVRAADAFARALHVSDASGHDARGHTAEAEAAGPIDRQRVRADGEVARVRPVDAVLDKRIPLGAGLGGGSADAAAALEGLNALWQANWSAERLSDVAATLGSDVPFFLHGPSSVCTGRGEHVHPVGPPALARWAVLVLPEVHMTTAEVYRRFDALDLGFDDALESPPDWTMWALLPADELMPRLVNDLEQPAFEIRPELGMLRQRIELLLARPVRMSGSGSSLFSLCKNHPEAESWAGLIVNSVGVRTIAVQLCPAVEDDRNSSFARA